MVKKATLDLLDEKISEDARAETDAPEGGEDKGGEEAPARVWFTRGRILAAASCGLILLVVGVLSLWMHARGKPAKPASAASNEVAAVSPASAAQPEGTALLKGFVIPLTDGNGNCRTLICDIALGVKGLEADARRFEGRPDVRNVIYDTARKRGTSLSDSRDDRNALRREINDKLNELLGGNRIASVYFTEFLIL